MKLSEAAQALGLSEKTLRRYIKAGILPATVIKTGRASRFDIALADIMPLTNTSQATPDALLGFMSATTSRLDALEAIVMASQETKKQTKPTTLTIGRCAQLARAHGVGYWTARKEWRWTAEERADEATALATIRDRAPTRFVRCNFLPCFCHGL